MQQPTAPPSATTAPTPSSAYSSSLWEGHVPITALQVGGGLVATLIFVWAGWQALASYSASAPRWRLVMRLMALLFGVAFVLSMAWVFDHPGGKAFWIAFGTWALLAAAVAVEVFVYGRSRLLGALSTVAGKPVLPKDVDAEINALKAEREGRKATHGQIKADALGAVLDQPIKAKDAERVTRALKTTVSDYASIRAALNRLVTVIKSGASPDDAVQEVRALKAAQGQLNALVTVIKPGAAPDDAAQQVRTLKADAQALTAECERQRVDFATSLQAKSAEYYRDLNERAHEHEKTICAMKEEHRAENHRFQKEAKERYDQELGAMRGEYQAELDKAHAELAQVRVQLETLRRKEGND